MGSAASGIRVLPAMERVSDPARMLEARTGRTFTRRYSTGKHGFALSLTSIPYLFL